MQRRRIPLWQPPVPDWKSIPAQQYPYRGTTPRAVHDNAFSPKFAPDLLSQAQIEVKMQNRGIAPVTDFLPDQDAQMRIPQLAQSLFPGIITGAGVANAIQLVPKNPDRWSLMVMNPGTNGNITFSFDAPIALGGFGLGIPLPSQNYWEERQGVSVNGIYVWTDDPAPTFPIAVAAYEGQLSVVSNQR